MKHVFKWIFGFGISLAMTASALAFSSCNSGPDPMCGTFGVGQGEDCSDPGQVCPGGSLICMSCGDAGYALTTSNCTCVSSKWSCGPPAPGQDSCPAVPQYADPKCTVSYSVSGALDGGTDDAGDSSDAALDGGSGTGTGYTE